jgi:hypothetical protein
LATAVNYRSGLEGILTNPKRRDASPMTRTGSSKWRIRTL